jgi:hypothetical protein
MFDNPPNLSFVFENTTLPTREYRSEVVTSSDVNPGNPIVTGFDDVTTVTIEGVMRSSMSRERTG